MQPHIEVQVFTVTASCACKPGTCAPEPDAVLVTVQRVLADAFGSRVPVRNVNVLSPEVFNYPQVIAAIRSRTHRVPIVAINGIPYMSERVDEGRLMQAVGQALVS
ncbi:MAG: hypothetical protein ACM3ZA_08395 [Bacillota bacterium]